MFLFKNSTPNSHNSGFSDFCQSKIIHIFFILIIHKPLHLVSTDLNIKIKSILQFDLNLFF